jgi:hypothetical protein
MRTSPRRDLKEQTAHKARISEANNEKWSGKRFFYIEGTV